MNDWRNGSEGQIGSDIDAYQEWTITTAIYPKEKSLEYTLFGLIGEVGELANKYKKVIRDKGGIIDESFCQEMSKEAGDIIWYWTRFLDELGISCSNVLWQNFIKLNDRKDRGVIKGEGDNR